MQTTTSNEITPVYGSILAKEKTRFNRVKNKKSASTEKKKTVMWDISSIEEQKKERRKESLNTESYVRSDNNQIGKASSLSSRNRRNSTRIMSNISQNFKLVFDDQLIIEVIDADGIIKKEKKTIRESCPNEFNIKRNKKYFNEYVKAAEFFNKNYEQRECDDVTEDTVTNTLRNQYAGKLDRLDSGAVHVPYKSR